MYCSSLFVLHLLLQLFYTALCRFVKKKLGAYGFTKSFKHRNEEYEVHIPDEVVVPSISCPRCTKTIVNTQGLGVHLRCIQGVKIKIKEQPQRQSYSVDGEIKHDVVRDIVSRVVSTLANKVAKSDILKISNNHIKSYPAVVKAKVLHALEHHKKISTQVAIEFCMNAISTFKMATSKTTDHTCCCFDTS